MGIFSPDISDVHSNIEGIRSTEVVMGPISSIGVRVGDVLK